MIPSQTFESYPVFGDNATKVQPDGAKYSNGFIQGDVYPAEWVNWAWAKNSQGITDANRGLTSIEAELNTMLTCAGITPSSCLTCTDQVYNAMMCKINACVGTAAPKAHASSATTYGVGNADCYGHLKISDTYTEVVASCTGVAASQQALVCVYTIADGKAAVGNTAGAALAATASAGTATTAARSDHVHPYPAQATALTDVTDSTKVIYAGYAGAGLKCSEINHLAAFSTSYLTGKTIIKDVPKANVQAFLGLGTAAYCASTAFLAASGTACCAHSACYVDRGVTSNNYNWHLLFGYSNAAASCSGVYASCGCPLTFNPSTGVLTAKCFCGRTSSADAASRLYANTIVFKSCYQSQSGTSPNIVKCYYIYACVCRNDTGCGVYLLSPVSVTCQGKITVCDYKCPNGQPRIYHLSTSCYTLVGSTTFTTSCTVSCDCTTEVDQLMLAIDL